jgi:hypothetical protein
VSSAAQALRIKKMGAPHAELLRCQFVGMVPNNYRVAKKKLKTTSYAGGANFVYFRFASLRLIPSQQSLAMAMTLADQDTQPQ